MIGKTISHYRIVEKLGEGGMGIVYKAEDTRLDRFVAIKFLPSHLSEDEESKSRFIHEAKASSALSHPNIGVIHEIDETPDGQTFIAMACYEGEPLRSVIDRGGVGVDQAIGITSQIAAGLARAHEKGIVHRDIKPSNVLITHDGRPVIIDFGLAKLAGGTRLTKEGSTLGTAAYMSPELAKGEEADRRSDIFSLGVLFYELLTGELPFRGTHEAALLYEIVHEQPEPLSKYKSGLPDDFQCVIDRALAKDPGERYQSAAEMLRDLDKYIEDSAIRRAIDLGRAYRSGASNRRRWIWGLTLLAAIIVVSAVFVVRQQRDSRLPASSESTLAVIGFRDLVDPDDATTSASITTLVNLGLEQSSPIRVISQELLYDLRRRLFGSRRGVIERDQVLEVARKSGSEFFLSGEVTGSGEQQYVVWRLVLTRSGESVGTSRVQGNNLIQLADLIVAEVLPLLDPQPKAGEKGGAYSVGSMTTDSPEAFEHYITGLLAKEQWDYNTAVREQEAAIGLDSTFALAHYELSNIYFKINPGSPDPRTNMYADNAWRHKDRLSLKDRLRLEAWHERINDRQMEAKEIYREILSRWPDDREVLKDLVDLLFYHWYWDEVIDVTRKGIELYPDEWTFNNLLANSLGLLGHLEEALSISKSYAERHPEDAHAWLEVGQRYWEMGLPDSAIVAIELSREKGSSDYNPLRYISYCHFNKGELEAAVDIQEQLLARIDLLIGQRVYLLTDTRQRPNLPVMHVEMGRFEKALSLFDDASRLVSDTDGRANIEFRRNGILLRMGRPAEVLRSTRELVGRSETPLVQYYGARLMARALVVLDSLEAARDYYDRALSHVEGGEKSWLLLVRAEIELAEKNPLAAISTLEEMKQKGMCNIGGLDNIEYRENLARAYAMAGQLDEAVNVHEEMLRVFRGHALSHFELGKLYEQMMRPKDAIREYELFLEMWSEVDEGLPQVEYAEKRLVALRE